MAREWRRETGEQGFFTIELGSSSRSAADGPTIDRISCSWDWCVDEECELCNYQRGSFVSEIDAVSWVRCVSIAEVEIGYGYAANKRGEDRNVGAWASDTQ